MADRALHRLGLDPVLLHKLQSQKFTSAKDILVTNPLELVERLDVDAGAITVLLETISASVLPEPVTVGIHGRRGQCKDTNLQLTLARP